jgi:hypothetical protein
MHTFEDPFYCVQLSSLTGCLPTNMFLFKFLGWSRIGSHGTAANNGPLVPALDEGRRLWDTGGMITDDENQTTQKKSVVAPLCSS